VILAALLLAATLAAADTPMTDDEVVRRLAAGEPAEAILADVQRRPPAFDVSEDMLAELRAAGVPERLLQAMIARAAQAPAAPAATTAAAPPMAELRLTPVDLTVTVSRRIDPQVVAELELPAGALEADALALAVFCTAHDHDDPGVLRWPAGRMPKGLADGRLLALFPAAEGDSSGSKLRVSLPNPMVVPLLAGVSHDILVAALLRAGGMWVVLTRDALHGARAPAGGFTPADLRVKRVNGFPRLTVRRPVDASVPELPRGTGWAKDGWFHAQREGGTWGAFSPDGRKQVRIGREGVTLEIEGEPAPGLSFSPPGDAEVLWSPDSRVVALTYASALGSSLTAWRIEPDDAVHAIPLAESLRTVPALAAVTFPGEGSRLLVVSREGGRLTGFLVNTSDGTVASRSTELEVRARWGDRLGPRLR
jgi:hypothetical protein